MTVRPLGLCTLIAAAACLGSGCMKPAMMPMTALSNDHLPGGGVLRLYDSDGDARGDYAERQGPDGRVQVLHLDSDGDGRLDAEIDLNAIDPEQCRELLIILDSVPYRAAAALWQQGRLRLFHPPSRLLAPFPVMTDLCINELFGISPAPGVEAPSYDGKRLSNGYVQYLSGGNSPWMQKIEACLHPMNHQHVYLNPHRGYLHELYEVQRTFFTSAQRVVRGYSVGASALGSIEGLPGHLAVLRAAERMTQEIMRRTAGRVRITLMSDHGHNLVESRYFPLQKQLRALGYRETRSLKKPGDIVLPRFGPVTCAAIYTNEPAEVAADAVMLEAVELSSYRDGDDVIVRSQGGRARITRSGDRYRYQAEVGDPLQLQHIVHDLQSKGLLDDRSFAAEADWFSHTSGHVYPDPLQRLWRAFNGLIRNTPQVLLSIHDGYVFGTRFFNFFVKMKSAHGSLRESNSMGFVMSTAGPLPDCVRMKDLAQELRKLGLHPVASPPDNSP